MMIKRVLVLTVLIAGLLLLMSCTSSTSMVEATATLSAVPPTPKVLPSDTPIAEPTETPTLTPTTSISSTNTIQHFPLGQEFTVTTIDMLDASNGWAIGGLAGASDHVLRTVDGGTTWIDLTPPEEVALVGDGKAATGYFADAQSAWVIYSNTSGATPAKSVVWHTGDGGATWQSSQPLDLADLNEFYNPSNLQFVDEQNGWVMVHVGVGMNHDYFVLYRTSDGGLTWERLVDPYNDMDGVMACYKTGMLFTDASNGWLTGDCQGVAAGVLLFKTADGGTTWQRVELPDPPDAAGLFTNMEAACGSYDPFFFSDTLGHIGVRCTHYDHDPITHVYYLFTTQDGGNTWSAAAYPGEGLYFLNEDIGWALSAKIQHTTDGGTTWKPISDVTWSAQLSFIDAQTGWGVAREGDQVALVKTVDGGARWAELMPTVGK